MTIEVEIQGTGQVVEFPDGTPPEVIQQSLASFQQTRVQTTPTGIEEAQEGFVGSGILEPAAALATGVVAEPLAGLAAIAAGGDPEAVRATREALTFQPRTEAGQAGLQTLGDLIQFGVDVAQIPISGLAGLGELITGQGLEQAAQTVRGVQDQGVGRTLGQRAFEETGSPLAATIAETAPTAALSATGLRTRAGGQPRLAPEQAARAETIVAAGQRARVPVLTSDIFQPETVVGRLSRQFSERIPGFGTGGKRGAQQTARINALETLNESTPKVQAADIIEGLNASANKARRAAGTRISNITGQMDQRGVVPVRSSIKSIDDAIEKLNDPRRVKSPELVSNLEDLRNTLNRSDQSFSSLREFRTDVRFISEKVDPAGRSQLRSGDKAILDSVVRGVSDDLDNFVSTSLGEQGLRRYKQADKVYAQEAKKLTKSRLKTILDKGDVNPELVNNLLFSSSPSQVELLFKNLDTAGRQNARLALMRDALDKSITKGEFSPEKFVTQLNKNRDNFKTFFRGESRAELEGFKKLMEATGRAGEAGVTTPTGQAIQIPLATGVAAGAAIGDPKSIATLLSAGTIGLAGRAYESTGVRNLLIRLGKAPKRSTLEADLLRSIPLVVESANRSLIENEQVSENRE